MDPERYRRLKKLVVEASELPRYQRDEFLQQHCEDSEQLAEARDLLNQTMSDQEEEGPGARLSADIPDLIGSKIGPYQILEPIGEGGMGQVYLAAQSAPLRRKVALKIIKLGMDTREVISRFESERQALALMNHPNIAKVFDAGATDQGRPYFVMEYIPGVPINRYCREKGLGLRQRLDLFLEVCQGVQHAHQKGIIHRDLKPGNILVTEVEGKPVPKIIDFGVAKATASGLTAMTLLTGVGQLIGTPEYMSPEQADSSLADVDTRSDVYSLGVLLYELLTGKLPLERIEILQAGIKGMAQMVQNEVPIKPSTRLDTEARHARHQRKVPELQAQLWASRVRGDLDWITMKALEKDRDRRYGSAADLAADLVRHQDHRAVSAGPPSGVYRLGKFVRRNRSGVTLAVALVVALVGFVVWQTIQSRIYTLERDKALANERLSEARGQITKDPTLAMAYALSSLEILDQPSTRKVVRQALAQGPIRQELPRWGQKGNPVTGDISADGRYFVIPWTHAGKPTLGVYDLTDYSMRVFQTPDADKSNDAFVATDVMFNSDGSLVTSLGTDGLNVWRVADGEHVFHLTSMVDNFTFFHFKLADPRKMALWLSNPGEHPTWYEMDILDGSLRELGRSIGIGSDQSMQLPAIDQAATWTLDIDGPRLYLQRVEDLGTDRAILVGEHEHNLSAVALDPTCSTGASVDFGGHIKVWDLTTSPPSLVREFQEEPGTWVVRFDPFGHRLTSSWGAASAKVYDLNPIPKRKPLLLQDRTHWTHQGIFLPDRSLITTRNGTWYPIVHWKSRYPVAWTLDESVFPGGVNKVDFFRDGRGLFIWTKEGEVIGMPLVSGVTEGVGSLGWTLSALSGVFSSFFPDLDRGHCLISSFGDQQLLDIKSGLTKALPDLKGSQLAMCLSESGRFAGFLDSRETELFTVYDLDSLRVAQIVHLGGKGWEDFAFTGDSAVVALGDHHITSFDLSRTAAQPDTLWRGNAIGGGGFLDYGRSAVVRDDEMLLSWVDLTAGKEVDLGKTPGGELWEFDYHPGLGLLGVGGTWDSLEVFDVKKGGKWSLPLRGEGRKVCSGLWIDPLGRWLISVGRDGIHAWDLPLDPLFGDPEYDVLLESLGSLTNVRVTVDESQPNGFRITNTLDPES